MKKIFPIIIIPIVVITLSWFFYTLNSSFQEEGPTKKILSTNEKTTTKSIDLALEDYIIGIVACEMPASFNIEALKAQAVAARTFALYQHNKKQVSYEVLSQTEDQCYITIDEMKDKWHSSFAKYYNIVKEAVMTTASIYMTKDNAIFKSFYFSSSNGYTEDSINVFKVDNIPSVSSVWDKDNKEYYREKIYTYRELEKILGEFKEIKIVSRNNTHHVEKVQVDETLYTGTVFRQKLGLRSTDFSITVDGDTYTFATYGYGHGVGMSQYGANALANLGKNYKEILNYYYSGVNFAKI